MGSLSPLAQLLDASIDPRTNKEGVLKLSKTLWMDY
jgi:hypothetical protein